MYALLNRSLDQIEKSLDKIEQENLEGKEYKNGAGVLPQQLYQLSIAFQNLRKEERETAAKPVATDHMTPEQLVETIADVLELEELEAMVERKRNHVKEKSTYKRRK